MHILCNSGMRAIPRAHPAGLIVRCRRKAMGPREEQSARVLRAEAKSKDERQKRSRFCSAALDSGPRQPRQGQAGTARRVARRDAREFANGQDAHRANPGLTLRTRSVAASAAPGGCFFAYFLCTSKESRTLARMRAEKRRDAVRKNQTPQQRLDSSFRWNDEQKSKDTGFRLPPE